MLSLPVQLPLTHHAVLGTLSLLNNTRQYETENERRKIDFLEKKELEKSAMNILWSTENFAATTFTSVECNKAHFAQF